MPAPPGIRAWILPTGLRSALRDPLGILTGEPGIAAAVEGRVVVTVGDITTLTVARLGIVPKLAVVDFRTQRKDREDLRAELLTVGTKVLHAGSPAGRITAELWDAVAAGMAAPVPVRLEVDGEEDLATLPAILEAPQGAVVLYGMPNRGVVAVTVDARARQRAQGLLQRFETVDAPTKG